MTREEVQAFLPRLREDAALRERLRESYMREVQHLGAQSGFAFSGTDLRVASARREAEGRLYLPRTSSNYYHLRLLCQAKERATATQVACRTRCLVRRPEAHR